jgi:hypothetical protein
VTLNYKLSNLPPPELSRRLLGQGWHTALPDCLICLACSTAKSIQQIRGVSPGTKKQVCGPDTLQASNQEVGEDMWPRPLIARALSLAGPNLLSRVGWRASFLRLRCQQAPDTDRIRMYAQPDPSTGGGHKKLGILHLKPLFARGLDGKIT